MDKSKQSQSLWIMLPPPSSFCLTCWVGVTCPGSQCRAQAGPCPPLLQSWLGSGRFSTTGNPCTLCFSHLVMSSALKIAALGSSLQLSVPFSFQPSPMDSGTGACCAVAQGLVYRWAVPNRWTALKFSPVESSLPFHSARSLSFCVKKRLVTLHPVLRRCLLPPVN